VPRGDPVHGIGVVGNLGAPTRQLIPKSYRARSTCQGRRRQRGEPLSERLRGEYQRLPKSLAGSGVEGGESLSAARVEDGEPRPAVRSDLRQAASQYVEGADAGRRHPGAGGESAGGGDADANPDEGAGTETDRDPPHRLPGSGSGDGSLDLGQQSGRVAWAAIGRRPDQLFVQDLAAARRADGGVGSRRIESDDRGALLGALSQ
jgi:hypothetical protein